jgi:hypothetical protein
MANLPKPLIGLLLGTVAFFAIWMVALKPNSSSSGGSPNGVGQYQSAINQAHQAVKTSNAANAKLGAPTATTAAPRTAAPKTADPRTAAPKAKTGASVHVNQLSLKQLNRLGHAFAPGAKESWSKQRAEVAGDEKASARALAAAEKEGVPFVPPAATPAEEVSALQTAVAGRDVVAILFYNPAATDDRAMKAELTAVPTHAGLFKLAVPVSELTQFAAITSQIPVVTAPTLIIIDPARQATTLTGYVSQLELDQRVADALAAH